MIFLPKKIRLNCRFTAWKVILEIFHVKRIDRGWRVIGESIERAADMTYWDYDQAIRRFHRILSTLGIDLHLRKLE